MELREIQRRLDAMAGVMVGKGKVQPEARCSLASDTEVVVSVSWMKRNAVQKYDRDYKAFRGLGIGYMLADAEAFIAALPDLEAEQEAAMVGAPPFTDELLTAYFEEVC